MEPELQRVVLDAVIAIDGALLRLSGDEHARREVEDLEASRDALMETLR
jgi:hypothetical protein